MKTKHQAHPIAVSINPTLEGLGLSETLAINEISKRLQAEGRSLYKFGLGQSPFPVPESVVAALRLYAPQKDYLSVKGLMPLRKAVAEFHRKKDLVNFSPENVMVGPGSKELLFLVQLVFNGEIIIPSPGWVSYLPQAKIIGREIRIVHSNYNDGWCIRPQTLRQWCEENETPKLLILNYPGNPDGASYNVDQLQALANVAREYGLIIISDEIYGQIHHTGEHVSIARFYPEGTIISSGLSKWCGAGGWRLGTFSFPDNLKWLMDAMAVVASETYTSVSAPIQYAAIQAFSGSAEIEEYLAHVRRILAQLGREMAVLLREAGLAVHNPVGAFYLFPDFESYREVLKQQGILNAHQLCKRLLDDCGVVTLPGSAFNRPESELTIRLAYVDFDGAAALQASRSYPLHQGLPDDFYSVWCENVVVGCQKIAQWLQEIRK